MAFPLVNRFPGRVRFALAGLCVGTLTIGIAGAATFQRFTVSQVTGSEGATTLLQNSSTGGALQAQVNTTPLTSVKVPFGVLGIYNSPGGPLSVGVGGFSTTGYGVGAESFGSAPTVYSSNESTGDGLNSNASSAGAGYGVNAVAAGTGDGVDGNALKSGWGGYFQSSTGIGVEGVSSGSAGSSTAAVYGYALGSAPAGYFEASGTGNALHAIADSTSGVGIEGDNSIGSRGILGDNTGEAIAAFGHSGNDHAVIAAVDAVGGTRLFETQAYNGGSPATSFFVAAGTANRSTEAVASNSTDVQISGDVYVYGTVFQNCQEFPATSSTGCQPVTADPETTGASVARSANGNTIAMFTPRTSTPRVEDEGTAELINGRAFVRMDPAFAQTMATDRPYRVFVTPNGPSRGVYVANRTQQGFEVDENPGGRSTVTFDYRIVAAPYGDRSQRLAIVPKKARAAFVPDPANAGLRAQAAEVRGFDLASVRAHSRAAIARHPQRKSPAPFLSFTGASTR